MYGILYVMIHLAKSTIKLFGIWYSFCKLYNQTCYTLLIAVKSNNISTNVGSIQLHLNYHAKTNYMK